MTIKWLSLINVLYIKFLNNKNSISPNQAETAYVH